MGRRCKVRQIIGSRLEWGYGLEWLEQRCYASVAPGAEFLVNTWTTDVQVTNSPGAISSDDAGNFVTVWESFNRDAASSYGVYGQRYAANGTRAGAEFLVNTTLLSDQRMPAVSMNGSGSFAVAWEGQGTLDPTFPGIYVRRYDATGAALGSEIAVAGTSLLAVNEAAVAMNASGAFVVAWEENGPTGRDIAARIYDASGSPIGAAFTVNQTTGGNQHQPQLVMDSAGNFVVTWCGNGIGDSAGVFARLFGPTGTPLTGEVLLNTTTGGTQSLSAIARDGNGQFMVVWSGNGTGDAAGVFGRRMTAAGVPTGSEFLVNATAAGTQQRPSVAFDADGDYVVTWSGQGGPDTSGIYAREYWSDDTPKAGELAVNTTVAGVQLNASVIATGDNRYALTWNGMGTGDADGVFGRLFVDIAPTISTSLGSSEYTEDGEPMVIDPGLTLSDADSTIASATVRISVNFMPAEDSLVFTDQLGITGSWNPVTGVLTLAGRAGAADYQTALQSVAYLNSSQNPSEAVRTVAFAVNDGSVGSTAPTHDVTVTPMNDAPVTTLSGGNAVFVEDAGPVPVDAALVVSDIDSDVLWGALVQITGNYVPAEDSLLFVDQLGIMGSWDAPSGTLGLFGLASLADYQTALRSVRYSNPSQDPSTAARTVNIEVSDGALPSPAASRDVSVVTVNDAPVLTGSGGGASYVEDAAAVVVDAGFAIADIDSGTMASATAQITGNYAAAEDVLVFTNQLGITGSWDAVTGTLTLVGAASLADYQTALRSVAYLNSSQNPSTPARAVTFIVNDGVDPSGPVLDAVGVMGVNDAPVVSTSGGNAGYTEDAAAVAVDAGLGVLDVDSALAAATVAITGNYLPGEDSLVFTNQLGITGSWDSTTGTLTLTGSASAAAYQTALRSVRYLNSSQNPSAAARTVAFAVNDGSLGSAAPTRGVTVTPVNDAPLLTAPGGSAAFVEDGGSVVINAALAVSDVDSATLAAATVAITGNYLPGEDSLVFTNQLGITGSWDSSSGTLTLTGSASVADYQTALRSVRYLNSSQNPSTAARTVTFAVTDGAAPSGAATGGVTVAALNDAPVLTPSGGGVGYTEDAAAVVIHGALAIADVDSGTLASATLRISGNYAAGEDRLVFTNQLGITGSWDSTTGTLTLTGVASLANYQAALRTVGYVNLSQNPSGLTRTVTMSVSDGVAASAAVSRTVSVTPVNDAPTAVSTPGSATYTQGGAAVPIDAGVVLGDVDSAMLSSALVRISGNFVAAQDSLVFTAQGGITGVWQASNGTLTLSGAASVAAYQDALRNVRYLNSSSSPSTAVRTVTMVVTDAAGAVSATASRAIQVVAIVAPPPPPPPTLPPPHPPGVPPHPAPPVVPPSHGRPPSPPWGLIRCDARGHAILPTGMPHAAEVILRIVSERLCWAGSGWVMLPGVYRHVVDALRESPRGPMGVGVWISVLSPTFLPERPHHDH